jgi:hypothetical protein
VRFSICCLELAPTVKLPLVPSSLAGSFFVGGGVSLDLLLAELSGKSSTGVQRSEEARFQEVSLDVLPGFWLFLSLAGVVALMDSTAIASL